MNPHVNKLEPGDLLRSVHHDGSPRYVIQPEGRPLRLGDEVTIRLRVGLDAPVERVLLRTCPDGEQQFSEMQLEPTPDLSQAACRWWRASLRLVMPTTGYRFLLFTRLGAFWYTGGGLQAHLPTDHQDFRLVTGYASPAWLKMAVFYQIFPDRFADGDPGNNVADGEFAVAGQPAVQRQWGEAPAAHGRAASLEFFGGDLQGIEQRLEYLEELGVNALYLTPIFPARSNHRYDVIDYYQVDPHLGGDPALISLRAATRRRGMRLVLDIVPNHCGYFHPWFQAALADPAAPEAEFFTFRRHPDEYASWLGVATLPKLNYSSQALRTRMYAGPEGVLRYWLRPPFAVDGWRLDVANMLGRQGADQLGIEVGQGIRQAVKAENPDAYLLGENFFDASSQLQGDLWDAAMNYSGFSKPLRYWLSGFQVRQHGQAQPYVSEARWTTEALVRSWQEYRAALPWAIARQQFNLLGSHDTPRILSVLGGDTALNRLAAAVLFTYPGNPCVYYGEEIGLAGSDRDIRACMPWDSQQWDTDLRRFYQTLIHLRRTSPALSEGGFQVLLAEDETLAYLRDAANELILVVAHRGPSGRPAGPLPVAAGAIPDGVEMEEVFSGLRRVVAGGSLPLPALSTGVQVWRAALAGG